jgi:hypothetical protein
MTDSCVVLRIETPQNSSNWVVKRCRTDYSHAICEKRIVQDDAYCGFLFIYLFIFVDYL